MDKTLILETKESHLIIKVADILKIEVDSNSSKVFLKKGIVHGSDLGLEFWTNTLTDLPFIKIHDHYLINLYEIESYDLGQKARIVLSNGENIDIQEKYKDVLKDFWSRVTRHASRNID